MVLLCRFAILSLQFFQKQQAKCAQPGMWAGKIKAIDCSCYNAAMLRKQMLLRPKISNASKGLNTNDIKVRRAFASCLSQFMEQALCLLVPWILVAKKAGPYGFEIQYVMVCRNKQQGEYLPPSILMLMYLFQIAAYALYRLPNRRKGKLRKSLHQFCTAKRYRGKRRFGGFFCY